MVLHDHKVLLFQCKSKALTYRARIGVDFDALRNDLRKAIGESFEQGVRARNYLQKGKGNSFTVGRVGFALDMVQVNGVYLISVTSMPFQSLAARLANSNSALGLFSDDMDRWVYEKFELGCQVDPPSSPMPEGFANFLNDVERSGDDYRTDCAMTLLELGSEGRKGFMQMIADIKKRSLQDNGLHSFSLVLKGGKRGLSFVSFDANADRTQLFQHAAAFAMLKKYESKCDEWTGFGWDVASSRAVDVTFFISEAWAHDAEVERLVREKLHPGHRVEL
jgi:hypothetical protein